MAVITIFLIIGYTFGLWFWLRYVKKTVSAKATKLLIALHLMSVLLLAVSAILDSWYSVSLRGIYTLRIIIWLFLLTGTLTYIIGHKSQFKKIRKWYFLAFSTFPIVASLLLLIPFLGVVVVGSLFLRLSTVGDTVYFSDEYIRVQSTFTGLLAPTWLEIYKKNGLLEKKVYRSEGNFPEVDSVRTIIQGDELVVYVYHNETEDTAHLLIVKVPN